MVTNQVSASVFGGRCAVAVDDATDTIYAVDAADAKVAVIDGADNSMTGSIGVQSPVGVGVDPVNNTVYVANAAADTVATFDAETHLETAEFPVGSSPTAIGLDAATATGTGMGYVANQGDNTISVVDPIGDGTTSVASATPDVCTASELSVSFVGSGACTLTPEIAAGNDFPGAFGIPQSFDVDATAPGAPSDVHETSGSGLITATWTAPVSTGGAPIADYTLTATPVGEGSPVTQTYASSATTETLSGHFEWNSLRPHGRGHEWQLRGFWACSRSGWRPTHAGAGQPGDHDHVDSAEGSIFSSTYVLSATGGGSSNDVTFTLDPATTNSACSLDADVVSFNRAGACVIDANELGNSAFEPALQIQQTITVPQETPSIT